MHTTLTSTLRDKHTTAMCNSRKTLGIWVTDGNCLRVKTPTLPSGSQIPQQLQVFQTSSHSWCIKTQIQRKNPQSHMHITTVQQSEEVWHSTNWWNFVFEWKLPHFPTALKFPNISSFSYSGHPQWIKTNTKKKTHSCRRRILVFICVNTTPLRQARLVDNSNWSRADFRQRRTNPTVP